MGTLREGEVWGGVGKGERGGGGKAFPWCLATVGQILPERARFFIPTFS